MNLTGSIADVTGPLSSELFSGSMGEVTGSSAIDTFIRTAVTLPNMLLAIIASAGADLGSSLVGPA